MSFRIFIFTSIALFLTLSTSLDALEADQYQIWKFPELKDSTGAVNDHLNTLLQENLDKRVNHPFRVSDHTKRLFNNKRAFSKHIKYRNRFITSKKPYRCDVVARKYMAYIRPHFFLNRFKRRLKKDSRVHFHPAKKRLIHDYNTSIYRGFIWPFWMPVSQSIRINRVYLGTDKLDHFFSSGRRYFNVYQRRKRRGLTHDEAVKQVIEFGSNIIEEKGLLGLITSGAFSYADLESNFQGMQMGINFCSPKKAHVRLNNQRRWIIHKPIDMKDYVNPLWDEAFNNSYYVKFRRKRIQEILRKEYCELGKSPQAKRLWNDYRKRLGPPAARIKTLQELIKTGKIPNPKPQSLANTCGYPEGVMEGVPYW
jgi:hypothetical protein